MNFLELEEIGNLADYQDTEDEPSEEDIFISSTGPLGSQDHAVCGASVVYHGNPDHTDQAIRAWMQENQYWPNVWAVSDHGNIHLHTLTC